MIQNIFKLLFLISLWLTVGCTDPDGEEQNTDQLTFKNQKGVFVLNEGNFMQGNGSISFCPLKNDSIVNDIFYSANQLPTGDVIQSMVILANEAWIVANNSGKVEVVDLATFKQKASISGFSSPRYLLPVSDDVIYLSDLYTPQVYILNLKTRQVLDSIAVQKPVERMLKIGSKVFMLNWTSYGGYTNNTLLVINTQTHTVVDSLIIAKEPNSMVVDKEGKLWVLCSGGFLHEEPAALVRIDPEALSIEKTMVFQDMDASPSQLCINAMADTLYFLNKDVFRMQFAEGLLPELPFVKATHNLFYGLGVCPSNSHVYVSDAIDYQQNGLVYRYSPKGELIYKIKAGIIPASFIFN
jgi:DNA-binding beta-propeller fold protein YncE